MFSSIFDARIDSMVRRYPATTIVSDEIIETRMENWHRPRTSLPFVLAKCVGRIASSSIAALAFALPASAQTANNAAVPAFTTVDSLEARVQGCVTCHGQSGEGTSNGYFPRIAGKPAGYLYNQLAAFRNGTRKYPPMNYLVAYLPESYLREIAEHFSKLQPPLAARDITPADHGVVARGQALVNGGDAGRGVPACTACHGERLTGMEPGIPGLVGLRPTYIIAQLTRWQVGDRHATEPDCMKRIATRLSDQDISAVAAWLSRQDAPKDLSPESSNVIRMPLACGSQPRK
jgi:cytochrome c553